MTKKTDEAFEQKATQAKFENRPTLDDSKVQNNATLSHNWQPGSPAVDLRYAGVSDAAVNLVSEEKAAEERKEQEDALYDECEYMSLEERSKLDVSHKCYANPSLGHVKNLKAK